MLVIVTTARGRDVRSYGNFISNRLAHISADMLACLGTNMLAFKSIYCSVNFDKLDTQLRFAI